MIDSGTSQESFSSNEYTFWKFRYAEKALNFWVERGDFNFDVSKKLGDAKFHLLDKVYILGASSLIPNINKETIKDYTACSFGLKFIPEEMDIYYNSSNDTIEIVPKAGGR